MTVTLLGATEIRRLAAELDVTPTKKLGQNFVVDANTVRKIVHAARVQPGERVVEVGPGLGSLTLAILEAGSIRHGRRDRSPSRRPTRADGGRARRRGRQAHGRRRRRAAHHRTARRADGARGEPALQRLGAGAAALPRALRLPAARRRDGAGRGRRAHRGEARLEDLRLAERQGGLVRRVAAVRALCRARCSGRCPNVDSLLVGFDRSAGRARHARTSADARSRSWMPRSTSAARCCVRRCRRCSAAPRRHPRC